MMTVIFIIIIFLVSAINVFGPIIKPYLPTATSEAGGAAELLQVKHVLFNPAVAGMLALLAVAAIASWIVTKKK
jgi:Na+-transporting methylmalonyl-CoA/oxaloacetate decarboxylase gamma subunit